MKNMRQLAFLMLNGESGSYNEDFKERFKRVGKKAMKELAGLLELKDYDINFNPGGIACSGDLRLMGMWDESHGAYIMMNKNFPNAPWGQILYRTIKHMKDFTGGPNCWLEYSVLQFQDAMKEKILQLRR
jgi:hypothetical protein